MIRQVIEQAVRRNLQLVILLVLGAIPSSAEAHGRPPDPNRPHSGLFMPPITHFQMPGMAAQAGAIRRLAEQLLWDDLDGKRLLQFVEYQSFACVWGLAPGSITDEDNPFNQCAHAYLAGVQAILARLQFVHGDLTAVRTLTRAVAEDPLAATPLCQFSAEGFWTGTIVSPDWADLPHHPEVLAWLMGWLAASGGATWGMISALGHLSTRAGTRSLIAGGTLADASAD